MAKVRGLDVMMRKVRMMDEAEVVGFAGSA